jgi:hypothetical protein
MKPAPHLVLALVVAGTLFAVAAVKTNAPSAHASVGSWAEPAAGTVVLGSKRYAPRGEGFGTVAPTRVYNGGVPSGDVTGIVWKDWGAPVATGNGLTWIYKPDGGYYPEQGAIELRAQSIGRCRNKKGKPSKQLAYRRLFARLAKYPGGPLGEWFRWSGSRTICNFKF